MASQQVRDPAQVYQAAVQALNRAQWQHALELARSLFAQASGHGGVWFVAGVAALNLGQQHVAVEYLDRAVRSNPDRADYWAQLARALAEMMMIGPALRAADASALCPNKDALTLETIGIVFARGNAHEKAAAAFEQVVALHPLHANAHFNLATSLTALGQVDAAAAAYERCLEIEPDYGKAHLALAQLGRQSASNNHVPRLRSRLERKPEDPSLRMYLHLALAKELEDLEAYADAFSHLSDGKAAGRAMRQYQPERDEALFEAIMAAMPTAPEGPPGHDSHRPIFVLGMPRSGTTLVERILSRHPDVASCGELQDFGTALKRLSGSRSGLLFDPDTAELGARVDWHKLGAAYIESTRLVSGDHRRFIDKLPHNFMYAGYIARALPNARIICLRREPLDTCLGNFRQLFAQTSPYYDYSFDLLHTGRYFVLFDRLMRHWHHVFPGRILDIQYEQLVDDQEMETKRLLAFCGLEWDADCLSFEQNQAPVATASASQVREPINRRGIGRWRRYREQLQPLRELLQQSGIVLNEC